MNDQHQSQRRHFLASSAFGLGGLALSWLLDREAKAAPPKPRLEPQTFDTRPKATDSPPSANAMISLWMQGGPSHIDMFDPKPVLNRLNGEKFPGEIKYDNAAQASSRILGSPWKFSRHGESGIELSQLVPHLANVIDDVCLIRSMRTGVNNHGQSIRAMNTGAILEGRPSLGGWVTYALGAETDNLPAFVALTDPGQLPVLGVENWSNGFLPSIYQGTVVRPQTPRILNLDAPSRLRGESQAGYLKVLARLNERHAAKRPGELDLQARIASYQLAARMQTAAKEALDLSQETAETKRLYGLDSPATKDFGSRCLIARRMVERGVRFVQVYTQNQFWDHHNRIKTSLPNACKKVDQPSAALVQDLKRRGLLDSTVVHWGGEMGRLPVIQNDVGEAKIGRDHNTHGFSMWVAGGGFRGGVAYGATDEFGHRAVENVVNHYDYHTTLAKLFGLDVQRFSYTMDARTRALIENQEGRVVKELLA